MKCGLIMLNRSKYGNAKRQVPELNKINEGNENNENS